MAESTQKEDIAQSWIRNYPEMFYDPATSSITCTKCETRLSAKKTIFNRHLNSQKHRSVQAAAPSDFYFDLVHFLIMCNIPWSKVDNPNFRNFFEKYICKCNNKDRTIPSESLLRKKYLSEIYDDKMKLIQSKIQNKKIWISLDETTDSLGRFVVNFLVKPLSENVSEPIYLLTCQALDVVNSRSVAEFVIQCLKNLWGCQFENKVQDVLILCTDSVAYMLLAGKILKNTFPNLKHFTCLAHALHRLTETLRLNYSDVDILISNVKKIFLKSPNRIRIFKELHPNLSLPPEPVITRWGTWLEAAFYYAKHLDKISSVVALLDSNEAISIRNVKAVLAKPNLKIDLNYLSENFEILNTSIVKLEKRDLSISEVFEIFDDVRFTINETLNNTLINKMEQLMDRNPDFDVLREISEKMSTDNCASIYKFAPLTSVDVERSFSIFKWILNVKRNRLTIENLEKIIVIYCNSLDVNGVSNKEQSQESDEKPSCSTQTSDSSDQIIEIDSD